MFQRREEEPPQRGGAVRMIEASVLTPPRPGPVHDRAPAPQSHLVPDPNWFGRPVTCVTRGDPEGWGGRGGASVVIAYPNRANFNGFEGDGAGVYSRLDRLIRIDTAGWRTIRIA